MASDGIESEKCLIQYGSIKGRQSKRKTESYETSIKIGAQILLSNLDEKTDVADKCKLRLKFKTKAGAHAGIKRFKDYLGEVGKAQFNHKYTDTSGAVNVSYKSTHDCKYSGRRQKPEEEKKQKQNRAANSGCKVVLHARILRPSPSHIRHDKYIHEYPCEVWFTGTHNHNVEVSAACKKLPMTQETRAILFGYFLEKLTPSQARRKLSSQLLDEDNCLLKIQDTSILPTPRQFYELWKKWREIQFGENSWESSVNKIELEFGSNKNIRISPERDAIAIVTPIMERTHKLLPQAKEMVFMDSTSNLDTTFTTMTFLLAASPIGGLPLAVILTDGQDKKSYINGLKLVGEITENYGFYGQKYPDIFMTDDCAAERGAIEEVFPQSVQLLCIFHVLQVSKYIHTHINYMT